jgi:predicted DNA-binding transcriptional regulator AlpA
MARLHSVLPPSIPPRGLSRQQAAEYIGVGATKFDEMVKDGRMPKPKQIDGRIVWDRVLLDEAFEGLEDAEAPTAPKNEWDGL